MGKVDVKGAPVVEGAFVNAEGKTIYLAAQREESEWGAKKVTEFYFENQTDKAIRVQVNNEPPRGIRFKPKESKMIPLGEEKKRIAAINVRMRVKKSADEDKLVTIRVPCKFVKNDKPRKKPARWPLRRGMILTAKEDDEINGYASDDADESDPEQDEAVPDEEGEESDDGWFGNSSSSSDEE